MQISGLGSPQDNRLLGLLPEDAYQRLLPHLEPCKLKPGQVLCEAGKKQHFAYFPTTSIIALIYFTANGDSSTVTMAGNDGMLGLDIVLGGESSPGRAVVQNPGMSWRVPAQAMREEFLNNKTVLQQWLLYGQTMMSQLAQLVVCNRHHRLEQQFCRWLLSSQDRLPSGRIDITQEMTASILGVRRQGISEVAARLEADGIISRARGQIELIDRPQLERRVCECYMLVNQEQTRLFSRLLAPAPRSQAADAASQPTPVPQEVTLLQQVVSTSDLGWSVTTCKNRVFSTLADARLCQMLGFEPGTMPQSDKELESLVHPKDIAERQAAIRAHLHGETPWFELEYRLQHQDGKWIWVHCRGKVTQRDPQGQAMQMVTTYMDITTHMETELTYKAMARTDYLTGVASRMYFFESADRDFARSVRYKTPLSLLALDLDSFKNINDKFGHANGDQVLKSFVQTVRTFLRGTDVFGRTGGEEFCLLLPATDLDGAVSLASRILAAVRLDKVTLGSESVNYTVSIGISERSAHHANFEALMVAADHQLYRAKTRGRDRMKYTPEGEQQRA